MESIPVNDFISVIIPVYNEDEVLGRLIQYLKSASFESKNLEIIVVEAGRKNNSENIFVDEDVIYVTSRIQQRGAQMNLGINSSKGDILYFLHADSFPPLNFDDKIRNVLNKNAADFGCFRMKFDSKNPFMSFYSYFTRFRHDIFHGGDASLFVRRSLFKKVNGFNEEMQLMEDYDIIRKLKRIGKFIVLPEKLTTSARKYNSNGVIRLQWIYFMIQIMYRMNVSQDKMLSYYQSKVK